MLDEKRDHQGIFGSGYVVVGSDGQCDFPGFNAKNLCYFVVEINSNYIPDIEVLTLKHKEAPHIVKHFWHCSTVCRQDNETSDENELKVMNVTILILSLLSL